MDRTLRAPRPWWAFLGAWIAVVVMARLTLRNLIEDGAHLRIPFPPLDAALDWRPGWRLVFSVVVGVATVVWAPRIAAVASWRLVVVGSSVLGASWAVSLALLDGVSGLTRSVALKHEYFGDIGRVGSAGLFLRDFARDLAGYRIHVQGHPPGYLLLLWALDRIGLGSVSAVATLEIVGGALAIPAVLLAVREVAGERNARAAAPFVAVAPLAIWVASSADAFYAGVSAWAVALVILATGRVGRRRDVYAFAGGLLFGATAFLSYGLVLLAIIPAVVAIRRRQLRPLALAAFGAAAVFALFALAGFWWLDGLRATRARYLAGVASRRPYFAFLLANAACFALALGPALAVALGRLRDRRVWLVVGSALLAVGIAWLSGMSKGEVERIWLPFAMWVLPAAAVLGLGARRSHWLALQVVCTIALQTLVRSPW